MAEMDDLKIFSIMIIIIVAIIGAYIFYERSNTGDDNGGYMNDQTDNSDNSVKEFRIKAGQWDFNPSSITVNKGDNVKLILSSGDVPHGFAISEYGINEYISSSSETSFQFKADKEGTFTFFCSVYCGDGHSGMTGTLIVI